MSEQKAVGPTCMASVNRVAKLPVVESSIEVATNVYEKVKDFNGLTQWTCNTAENVAHIAMECTKPIVQSLEGPIKKVDDALCTGLDYVENKVPAMKLPPGEIICQIVQATTDYMNNTVAPAVGHAYGLVEPSVRSAYGKIEPAVETAKKVLEPTVEKAMTLVEPVAEKAYSFAEPAIEKAKSYVEPALESISQFGQKVRECAREHPEGSLECDECKAHAERMDQH